MNWRRATLIAGLLPPALIVLYFAAKHVLYEPAAPLHEYENRLDKRALQRADFRSATQCEPCHSEIYDDWKESYLSKSYTAAVKEIELHRVTLQLRGIDPQEIRFCIECHAPLALTSPEDLDVLDPVSQEGVTCTVCHSVVDASADAAPANFVMDPLAGMGGPFDDSVSPFHRTEFRELFEIDNSTLCGACHTSKWPRNGLAIDWTYKEWHEARFLESGEKHPSAPVEDTCQGCHMPEYEGKAASLAGVETRTLRRHSFPGGHDPEFVREAAEIEVQTTRNDGGLSIDVLVRNLAGHNLPSGNPPAPELRLQVMDGGRIVDSRSYRAAHLTWLGKNTLDVTVADRPGNDTSLLPYEERREHFQVQRADTVRLEFSYWRPYEPSQRLPSYTSTIFDHLTHPDANLLNVGRTLGQKRTWMALWNAIGSSKGDPIVIVDVDLR